jgi:hypothetical protein
MTNNAMMREKLERLKMKQASLRIEAKGIANDIPVLINPALEEVEDLRVAEAAMKMDDLVSKQGELISWRAKIWQIEEQLNG